tara:strand:- start:6396 stop:6872 length:477 start_codon:yes stop_codon:yes gene_type:complete
MNELNPTQTYEIYKVAFDVVVNDDWVEPDWKREIQSGFDADPNSEERAITILGEVESVLVEHSVRKPSPADVLALIEIGLEQLASQTNMAGMSIDELDKLNLHFEAVGGSLNKLTGNLELAKTDRTRPYDASKLAKTDDGSKILFSSEPAPEDNPNVS